MTEETGLKILNILRASYPGESWKLKDDKGDNFLVMILEIFDRVPDDVMINAIKIVIKSCKEFPSIGDISNCVSQVRPQPKYAELPQHREKIDMTIIHEALRLAADHKVKIKISDRLRKFSLKYFPDISDELIRRNYCELTKCMYFNMQLDGHKLSMRMDKDGDIDTFVII